MKYLFETVDIQRILEPKVYFVGAMYGGEEDQLPRFLDDGIWENGYGDEKERYANRQSGIKKGDQLWVKRLTGRSKPGEGTMLILAGGVVVAQAAKPGRFYVEWSVPQADLEVPLKEIGTLSCGYSEQQVAELSYHLVKLVSTCKHRFLRVNLNVERRNWSPSY